MENNTIENLGLRVAREISNAGTEELPMGSESITGISIIEAESLDDAEKMAQ